MGGVSEVFQTETGGLELKQLGEREELPSVELRQQRLLKHRGDILTSPPVELDH
jgi:hypothetical protein